MLGRTVLLGHTALCLPIAGLLPSAHLAQVLGALGRSAPHLHVAQGSGLHHTAQPQLHEARGTGAPYGTGPPTTGLAAPARWFNHSNIKSFTPFSGVRLSDFL